MLCSATVGLLGLPVLLVLRAGISGVAANPKPLCTAGESQPAACVEDALLRRGSDGIALIQHRGALSSTSVLRVDAARIAAHVRSHGSDPAKLATSLQLGLEAFDAAAEFWTVSPPRVAEGISVLATELFKVVEVMIPENTSSTDDFAEFRKEWMRIFNELPAIAQSIEDDVEAFAIDGATDKLIRAINTVLLEVGTVVTRLLPEETGVEVAKYLGAVMDVIDGVGEGIEAFENGEAGVGVEAIYEGMKAAVEDLVPLEVRNNVTYIAVVSVLDATLGSINRHMLEYKRELELSNVCLKGFVSRTRRRPSKCEQGYAWDGEQWCLYRRLSPYTIQNVRSGLYLNVWAGSRSDGANVVVWNNPQSEHSQWQIHQAAGGMYTIRNVNGGTYLHVEGNAELGANVKMSSDVAIVQSKWRLSLAGPDGVYTIQSAWSGQCIAIEGGSSRRGTNVQVSNNTSSMDSRWRIIEAWSGTPFQSPSASRIDLLEHSAAAKRSGGALPALCDETSGFTDKRGAWCYGGCPAGYEASGARCKARCSAAYPSDSDLMCGKSTGAIAAATTRMITETARQAITIASLVESMRSSGLDIATGLTATMQAFVDMGKPFAHPDCPV